MSLQTAKPLPAEQETSCTETEAETQSEQPASSSEESDSFVTVFPDSGTFGLESLSLNEIESVSSGNADRLTSKELKEAAEVLRNAKMAVAAKQLENVSRMRDSMEAIKISKTQNSLAGIRSILKEYSSLLENPETRQRFLNAAVFCAYGGRRMLSNACHWDSSLRNIESLRKPVILNAQKELNISLLCRLGHIILWKSQQEGGDNLGLYSLKTRSATLQIGGDTLWGEPRRRGGISYTKWGILGSIRDSFTVDEEGFKDILDLLHMV